MPDRAGAARARRPGGTGAAGALERLVRCPVSDAAADAGHYDMAMIAYNVINGGYVDAALRHAAAKGVGVIAMKAAHAVATHHKPLQPVPEWRVQ